jgi:hypothetical protein
MAWVPSEATRKLWSEQRKGNTWNRGKKHSEEFRQRLRVIAIERGCQPPVTVVCGQCGKSFEKPAAWAKRGRHDFCTKECYDSFQKKDRVTKQCVICGGDFQVRPCEQHKFSTCSRPECRASNKRSGHNPNWRGGVSGPRKSDMSTERYRAWRLGVFERDDYTCQGASCGRRGGDLHAHHIKPWAWFPELRYDVNNGLTLCKPCHEMTYNEVFKQRPTSSS